MEETVKHILIVEMDPDYADEVWTFLKKRNMKHNMILIDDTLRNAASDQSETFKTRLADMVLSM